MKKIYLIGLIMILVGTFFFNLVNASLCNDIPEITEMPCIIQTIPLNCSANAYIFDTNNADINTSAAMTINNASCTSDCVYNVTFGYNNPSNYNINLCDNVTYGVINVVRERTQATTQNNVNWVAQTISTPTNVNATAPFLIQAKQLSLGIWDMIKELAKRFWWIIIFLVLVLVYIIARTKKKKEKK